MNKKDELLKKIEDGRKALIELEKLQKDNLKDFAIKKIDEYTDKEKIIFFDKMYNSALKELEETEKNGYHNDNNEHYAWEEYIEILSRDNDEFWKYWNSIGE